tara:strand:- start:4025 stop:4378 length:354 start_codon:yes stop_codon:yes gene_type:complete
MKIQFDHNKNSLSGSLNLPKGRITEIKDTLRELGSEGNYDSKSELIEQVINEANLIEPAELFVLGTIFGVMDYMYTNTNDDGEFEEQVKDTVIKANRSSILKIDKFKKEMRNGDGEF